MDKKKTYSIWFLMPAFVIFVIFYIIPTISSLYYSLTIWSIDGAEFCGLNNFKMFFSENSLSIGIKNTLIFSVLTCLIKVILGFAIALFLTSGIRTKNLLRSIVFFPNLISTVAVGITFKALLHPTKGLFNSFLDLFGAGGTDWLGNAKLALYTVIGVDGWKGLSMAVVIFIAGIISVDKTYYEAAQIDGASWFQRLRFITLPLTRGSRNSIIILSFIGGLRSFELIWSMTGGGPGFATDVLASIIYKQYADGFYGLSTAGNVIMLVMIACLAFPLQAFLRRREVD